MAWTQNKVHHCPYTKGSLGIAKFNPDVIALLTGAVHEKDEWLAYLVGTRSKDGYNVNIEALEVPPQTRSSSNCGFTNQEVDLTTRIGVVHSHHTMGAFFSGTDDQDFNLKFGFSIVISSKLTDPEHHWLGFSYKAVGTVKLPCGSRGLSEFLVLPDGVKDYPWYGTPIEIEAKHDKKDEVKLGDCDNYTQEGTPWEFHRKGACGLSETETSYGYRMFGAREDILTVLPPAIRPVTGLSKRERKRLNHSYKTQQHGSYATIYTLDDYYKYWKDDEEEREKSDLEAIREEMRKEGLLW